MFCSSGTASNQMYPMTALYSSRSAFSQKPSALRSPSTFVLAMRTLVSFRMSFSLWM